MDVARPIASVVPSLDGPVLGVLAGLKGPLSLSDVHNMTGVGSISGIRRVLLRLVAAGIVKSVPGGYELNREHLAVPAIEALSNLHGELLTRIRLLLDEWQGSVALAGLFGSAARRDGDEHSDIDILVVSDSPGLDELVDDLAERIRVWTGNNAHVIGRTMAELRELEKAGEPIVSGWERDLLTIQGDPALLRRAA